MMFLLFIRDESFQRKDIDHAYFDYEFTDIDRHIFYWGAKCCMCYTNFSMCFPIAGELEKTMAECIIESELETETKVVRRLKNILDKEIQEISTLKRNVSRTLQEYTSLKRSHEVSAPLPIINLTRIRHYVHVCSLRRPEKRARESE